MGKLKKYMTFGKRIYSFQKRATGSLQLYSFRYNELKLENEKSDFAVDEEKIADRIGIAHF